MTEVHCQCEHVSHIEPDRHNVAHEYYAPVPSVQPVKTPFGTFHVCTDCAGDCLLIYVNHKVKG